MIRLRCIRGTFSDPRIEFKQAIMFFWQHVVRIEATRISVRTGDRELILIYLASCYSELVDAMCHLGVEMTVNVRIYGVLGGHFNEEHAPRSENPISREDIRDSSSAYSTRSF